MSVVLYMCITINIRSVVMDTNGCSYIGGFIKFTVYSLHTIHDVT